MRISASAVIALAALAVTGRLADGHRTRRKRVPSIPQSSSRSSTRIRGSPVIVHFWGLTCGNCMAELKDWGALVQAHPEATLILVNWGDERGARPAQIGPALATAGLGAASDFRAGLMASRTSCGSRSIANGWASFPIRG